MSIENYRRPQHKVDPLFLSRWSPRALTGDAVPDDVLFSCFEAARWAPSGGNGQPWRFIFAKRDSAEWERFLGFLNERNRSWAKQAGALVIVVSRKVRETDDGPRPFRSHSFDTGAAWSGFAHQARLLGWSTRAMGGINIDVIRTTLNIPEHFEIEIAVAIGKAADKSVLPESLQAAETPTERLPLSQLVTEGVFSFA